MSGVAQADAAVRNVGKGIVAKAESLNDLFSKPVFSDANKWGTFEQRVKWIIQTALQGALFLVVGVLETVGLLIMKLDVIIIYALYGLVLLLVRAFILWLCPPLAKVSKLLAGIIDTIINFLNTAFNALYDGVNTIMGFINKDVIGLINDIAKILGQHTIGTVDFNGLKWQNINGVSPDEVKNFLTALPPTCKRLGGMAKIMLFLVEMVSAASVCPIVRYMYPLEETYNTDVFETAFGWLYSGSADPILYNNNTNCMAADTRSTSPSAVEATCLVLGLPFLYLELFLPIIIIGCVYTGFSSGLGKIWSIVVYFVYEAIETGIETIVVTFKSIVLF